MIRIAICDDSHAFLNQTGSMIEGWKEKPENLSVESFLSGDALICAHSQTPFDIIFLDVVMPLMNGIETAREIRDKDKRVKIVFLSSSSEYGVDSYTVKANNYLLKSSPPRAFFDCLSELLTEFKDSSRFATVKGIDAVHRVPLSDIECVESQGKHIVFHLTGNRTIESATPLYAYEDVLVIEDGFFKCHRSYIVNIGQIKSYSHSEIVLHSGLVLPISRSCRKDFDTAYFNIVFGRVGDDK